MAIREERQNNANSTKWEYQRSLIYHSHVIFQIYVFPTPMYNVIILENGHFILSLFQKNGETSRTNMCIYSERKGNLIYYNLLFFVPLADMWKRRKCSGDITYRNMSVPLFTWQMYWNGTKLHFILHAKNLARTLLLWVTFTKMLKTTG